ncbi:hypothetical protein LVS98_25235, partial [Klebsiella pneumoniae]|nr:hypothetical protein [Klebsiella pneumoniae]
ADRNRSHWSTSKTPSYTKSVSWQHHRIICKFTLGHEKNKMAKKDARNKAGRPADGLPSG